MLSQITTVANKRKFLYIKKLCNFGVLRGEKYGLRFLFLLILNVPVAALAGDNMAWPQDGPELLWTAPGIGHGYSSVAIVGGRIFTAGMIDKKTYVTDLDLTGKKLWQRLNGQSW